MQNRTTASSLFLGFFILPDSPRIVDARFYFQSLSQDECFGHFASGQIQDAAKCRTGDLHLGRSLFMIKALIVSKPDRLEFVKAQRHFFQLCERNAPWLEIVRIRFTSYVSAFFWPRHT